MAFSAYRPSALAALPPSATLFQYDEDGDVVMTDAASGSPIRYSGSPVAPWAPQRSYSPLDSASQEGELDEVTRNLALEMLEAVLQGEPREDDDEMPPLISTRIADNPNGLILPPPLPSQAAGPPPGGEGGEEDWCLSAMIPDLTLRLDMRHPRVILNFLRFVSTYNELAPHGEEIHLPPLSQETYDYIVAHPGVAEPASEFAEEVGELRALLDRSRCWCPECE